MIIVTPSKVTDASFHDLKINIDPGESTVVAGGSHLRGIVTNVSTGDSGLSATGQYCAKISWGSLFSQGKHTTGAPLDTDLRSLISVSMVGPSVKLASSRRITRPRSSMFCLCKSASLSTPSYLSTQASIVFVSVVFRPMGTSAGRHAAMACISCGGTSRTGVLQHSLVIYCFHFT